MTDLVERLRAGGCKPSHGCHPDICVCALADDAADEIERLTAYVEEWKRRYETARLAHEEGRAEIERLQERLYVALQTCRSRADEIERLRNENEELRRGAAWRKGAEQ